MCGEKGRSSAGIPAGRRVASIRCCRRMSRFESCHHGRRGLFEAGEGYVRREWAPFRGDPCLQQGRLDLLLQKDQLRALLQSDPKHPGMPVRREVPDTGQGKGERDKTDTRQGALDTGACQGADLPYEAEGQMCFGGADPLYAGNFS